MIGKILDTNSNYILVKFNNGMITNIDKNSIPSSCKIGDKINISPCSTKESEKDSIQFL